ncbi:heparinase [Pararhizobium mangrovi]|uniref:Heparinase n=1 Tax=Pararhizobium mangrovi TaxID=2590452 RepID=A0A506U2V0_9HYPH|nr:heparinase [Pararhizobium mangrovi]
MVSESPARRFLAEARRRLARRRAAWGVSARRLTSGPDHILVAPADLRAGDAHIADEIYAGRFPLAGRILETQGASPFTIALPSREFAEELHAFAWLRNLRAAGHPLSYANGRALVSDWIRLHGNRAEGVAWEIDVVARRLIAWLSHSSILFKDADRRFRRRFLKSLSVQAAYLGRVAASARDGEERMRVRIALALVSICLPATPSAIRLAARRLDAELDRQILPDGTHISRNPQAALDILVDLLPLRQSAASVGHDPSVRLISAIDRMFPALRFFRHRDGALALFNGGSAASGERLAAVLRHDDTTAGRLRELPHGGFQRLGAGDTVVIADTGPTPAGNVGLQANGGCLAFEMSTGRDRLIVNAGAPVHDRETYLRFSRATAAHSTATIADISQVRVETSRFAGPRLVAGVTNVTATPQDSDTGARAFSATHDAYLARYGISHERQLRLEADGSSLIGRDRFLGADGRLADTVRLEAVLRFHLHPAVTVEERDGEIVLVPPGGHRWAFVCLDAQAKVEDDVFFADSAGPRRSHQIVVSVIISQTPELQWTLGRA